MRNPKYTLETRYPLTEDGKGDYSHKMELVFLPNSKTTKFEVLLDGKYLCSSWTLGDACEELNKRFERRFGHK